MILRTLRVDPRAEALIFDLDGTLADTMPLHVEAWMRTGNYFDTPITAEMINRLNGTPTLQVVDELNKLYGWSLIPELVRAYKDKQYGEIANKSGPIRPIKPIYDLAKSAHGHYPMAIGTGSTKKNAYRALREMGVENWFDAVITADDVVHPKPRPDTFLLCAELMDTDPSVCQVFEDGPMGLLAAERAGMIVTNVLEA